MPLPLAIQLYTFRDPARFGGAGMGLDVPTLTAIAAAGFLGVETVDVPGGDPAAARQVLDDLGLAIASSHTWADVADADAVARAAAALAELGSSRMIVSQGPLATVDAVDAFADRLAAAAEVAGAHGLRLGYHNHDTEMHAVDGTPVIDRLAARLGDAIDFQVDIFWVAVGGAEPAEVVARLGERVVSLHIKDGRRPAADGLWRAAVRQRAGGRRHRRPGTGHRRGRGPAVRRVAHRRVRPRRGLARRRRPSQPRQPRRARPRPRPGHVTADVRPARVGIVGCGNVTDLYLPGVARFPIDRAGGLRRPRRGEGGRPRRRAAASRRWPSTR